MYLILNLLLLPIWIYIFIKANKKSKKEIIICGILFGIAAVVISKMYSLVDYWHPKFILNGFLLEDFLYGFIFGGISSEIVEVIFKVKERHIEKKRYYLGIIFFVITICTFLLLVNVLHIRSIFAHIIPPLIVGIICIIYDRRYLKMTLISGLLSLLITIIYQNILLFIYPNLFSDFWYTSNLTGVYIIRIPLEELLFAFSLGFGASCFYELIMGKIYIKKKNMIK